MQLLPADGAAPGRGAGLPEDLHVDKVMAIEVLYRHLSAGRMVHMRMDKE